MLINAYPYLFCLGFGCVLHAPDRLSLGPKGGKPHFEFRNERTKQTCHASRIETGWNRYARPCKQKRPGDIIRSMTPRYIHSFCRKSRGIL